MKKLIFLLFILTSSLACKKDEDKIIKKSDLTITIKLNNQARKGCDVSLRSENKVIASKKTNYDGKVTFDNLPNGAYTINSKLEIQTPKYLLKYTANKSISAQNEKEYITLYLQPV